MGLRNLIEKLITEHGSAAILRDHRNLLIDRHNGEIQTRDLKIGELKSKNIDLESKIEKLTIALNQANALIAAFERQESYRNRPLNPHNFTPDRKFYLGH